MLKQLYDKYKQVSEEYGRLQKQKIELANRLVTYNNENGLDFKCWRNVTKASSWIDCQKAFTKPTIDIYSQHREFLDSNYDLLKDIYKNKQTIDKYSSLNVLQLTKQIMDGKDDIQNIVNNSRKLYSKLNMDSDSELQTLSFKVLHLIMDVADNATKYANFNNTDICSKELQKSMFKINYMNSILTDMRDVYGRTLDCLGLKYVYDIANFEQKLDKIQDKIDFFENNKLQLLTILMTLDKITSVTDKYNFNKVKTPNGQMPQAYIDFQRKWIVLDIDNLLQKLTNAINNAEYTKEWLDDIDSLSKQTNDALQDVKIDIEVLKKCGIVY